MIRIKINVKGFTQRIFKMVRLKELKDLIECAGSPANNHIKILVLVAPLAVPSQRFVHLSPSLACLLDLAAGWIVLGSLMSSSLELLTTVMTASWVSATGSLSCL